MIQMILRIPRVLLGFVVVLLFLASFPVALSAQPSYDTCKRNGPNHPTDPCYVEPTDSKYGFNGGLAWGKGRSIALEWGYRYSVDRCSLGHDRHFWSNGLKQGTPEEDYSNNLGFYRCVALVRPDCLSSRFCLIERGAQDWTMGHFEDWLKKNRGKDYPYAALPMDLTRIDQKNAKPFTHAVVTARECHIKFPRYVHPTKRTVYEPAFFDARKGGECWACPKGYKPTIWGLMAPNKCEKGGVLGVGSSHAYAKYVGKADKVSRAWYVVGVSYGCPNGYRRTYDRDFEAGLNNWKVGLAKRDSLAPDKDPNACVPTASPDT